MSDRNENAGLTRRDLLRSLGLGGAALASTPLLSACGLGIGDTGTSTANGAQKVKGAFDWRKAEEAIGPRQMLAVPAVE